MDKTRSIWRHSAMKLRKIFTAIGMLLDLVPHGASATAILTELGYNVKTFVSSHVGLTQGPTGRLWPLRCSDLWKGCEPANESTTSPQRRREREEVRRTEPETPGAPSLPSLFDLRRLPGHSRVRSFLVEPFSVPLRLAMNGSCGITSLLLASQF